jgi:rhodanese-related sulfurtransferase
MTKSVTADELKRMLSDGGEIAVLDVREHGIYGEGHLFFAVHLPYSRFEADLAALVPNPAVRVVFYDDDDGIAAKAAAHATAMGYGNVAVLEGGAAAWKASGYTLYQGVNLPSKTFGELVELERHTPHISAEELQRMRDTDENMVIVDGRTPEEYRRFSIPDGISCPNGELALRIAEIAPDPSTKIVVNCAGRTRSIIGAQTLIDFGVPNPVVALENGTQGWFLAGFKVANGADRMYPRDVRQNTLEERRAKAEAFASKCGAGRASASEVAAWLGDQSRTTYVFDIRTAEEFAEDGASATVHAPGGQLIQATDQWVGVRNARLVVVDSEGVRAPMVSGWLQQLGFEAYALEGGVSAASELPEQSRIADLEVPETVSAAELAEMLADGGVRIFDIRPSMTYRAGHIAGSVWSIRPKLAGAVAGMDDAVVLIADDKAVAALAAWELEELGVDDVSVILDGQKAWEAAGLRVESTPETPPDAECIDYLFFTHERHKGVEAAARQYLQWELGLVEQLDEQERSVFRIVS